MVSKQTHFDVLSINNPCDGVDAYRVKFESNYIPDPEAKCSTRKAFGRAILITPSEVELRLFPFYELIHRSWRPGTRNFVREDPHINLGTSVKQFVYEDGGPELKDLWGDRGGSVREEVFRCVFACNTLQTGFVRGNLQLAFASPIILWDDQFPDIPFHDNPKDANDPSSGRGTIGNEVNWPPTKTATSFTAFGCTGCETQTTPFPTHLVERHVSRLPRPSIKDFKV